MTRDDVRISRFLSLVLRHRPEAVGLQLDEHGWASIDALLTGAALARQQLTLDDLARVVASNEKRRFVISTDRLRIRAVQGHSVRIDLGLSPTEPPSLLFHGTSRRFLHAILASGLHPRSRQYVHLSAHAETALQVGARHGAPIVLDVDAKALADLGHAFYRAENGVWLTDRVPREYLTIVSESDGTS